MEREHGATLVDVLATLTLIGIVAAIGIPNLETARRRAGLDTLARTIISNAQLCRMHAINAKRNAGLVFSRDRGRWSFIPALDGDGDGVSRKDVLRGTDPRIAPPVYLDALCAGAQIGVPEQWRVPDPAGRGRLRAGDGLAAGRSDIISFSALGDATPASVYLGDGRERLLVLRIYGGTARVRVLEWRTGWTRWRQISL